jgi:diguanylate cyclase (GGDEF)-like protein/PAS domain S-box-containing protein
VQSLLTTKKSVQPISRRIYSVITLWFWTVLLGASPAQALETVVLQLRWMHQFQFAGYYAALHQGYYLDAGLNVAISEGGPGADPVGDVLAGHADFGIGTSSLVIDYLKGKPLMMLGPVFQHSPNVLIVRARDQRPVDLALAKDAKIALMGGNQDIELKAMFLDEGIALDKLHFVPDERHLDDFIAGRIAALNAYTSNEPYQLDQLGIDYTVLSPHSYGMDFYGDVLFTRRALVEDRPAMVAAFRAATLRGWQYALDHQSEMIDLILARYNSQQKTREHLAFEAREIHRLINPEVIQLGHNNPGRWQHITQTYQRFELAQADQPLEGFFYQSDPNADLAWLYRMLATALGVLIVVLGIAAYIHRKNRQLQTALAASDEARNALRVSEERHRLLADNASDVIWTMDLDGRNTYISPSVERMRGYTVAEALQQTLHEALTPASAQIAQAGLDRALEAIKAKKRIPDFRAELEQPCKQGGTVWTEVSFSGIQNQTGEFVNFLGVTRDISERKRAEVDLHIAAIAFESQDSMIVTDSNKVILRVNAAFTQITGYEAWEAIGKTPRILRSDRHDENFYASIWETVAQTGAWHGEIWHRRKDGQVYPEQASLTSVKGSGAQVTYYVGVMRDITERKQLEEEVKQLAFFDTLTQLPNRRLFNDRLGQSLARAKREQASLALMFIDLDKFKPINDTHGHEAGDWVLQAVAKRIESCLRASDTAARVGGDEFLVLLPDLQTSADAFAVAKKIRLKLEQPFVIPSGVTLLASASIGIAIFPDHAQTEQDLMRLGDRAMYEAKNAGGNFVQMCVLLAEPARGQDQRAH